MDQTVVRRVILIDDDDASIFIAKRLLNATGKFSEILVFKNGKSALDYIKENCMMEERQKEIELIILDINMPVMNGFMFLDELNELKLIDNFKILMLSASDNSKDIDEALKYNINGILNKPLHKVQLEYILEDMSIS